MASRKSPLRDRLLSNSPDPIKSSILRESGMGWNTAPQSTGSVSSTTSTTSTASTESSSSSSVTSPLRIAKRASPDQPRRPVVARRSSSSYKHMHSNNLVSKSPFKSQIPTPLATSRPAPIAITFPISTPTRRTSLEKRPRPESLHEQSEAENERPFAAKRERKQSSVLEGLSQKEPVTKSPFRVGPRVPSGGQRKSPPVRTRPYSSYIPQSANTPSRIPAPAAQGPGPSPGRSALVSRRMHGPRLSGSGRRERRKTVTFDERCDVLEFDRDEDDDGVFESSEEDDGSFEGDIRDINIPNLAAEDNGQSDNMDQDEQDGSYDSVSLSEEEKKVDTLLNMDPDASITGIVDQMFFSQNGIATADTSVGSRASTPPRHSGLPADLETEDGVPLGRSHHVERFLQHQQHHSPHLQQPPHFSSQNNSPRSSGTYPFSFNLPTRASPNGPPATPPRRSPGMMHSTPPLGRSTHVERAKQAREDDDADTEGEVRMLPPSPSPLKPSRRESVEDGLIPRFGLGNGSHISSSRDVSVDMGVDPFEHSRIQDVSVPEDPDNSSVADNLKSANTSADTSGINLSHLVNPPESDEEDSNVPAPGHDSIIDDSDSPNPSPPGSLNSSFEAPAPAPHTRAASASPLPRPISTYTRAGSASPLPPPASPYARATSASPLTRPASPFARAASASPHRAGSPLTRVTSPLANSAQSPQSLRPRISKEDVKRRLLGRRSPGDLASPSTPPEAGIEQTTTPIPSNHDSNQGTPLAVQDDNRDQLSIITALTDASTEPSVVEQAERTSVTMGSFVSNDESRDDAELGLRPAAERLKFDFGSKFSLGGLGISGTDDSNMSIVVDVSTPSTAQSGTRPGFTERTGMRMGDKDVDMDMKSALDRLMEDVAGGPVEDSIMTDDSFASQDSHATTLSEPDPTSSRPKVLERAATDSALLHSGVDGLTSRTASGSSTSTVPPPVPPKDSIKSREQLILEKRREARRMQESDDDDDVADLPKASQKHLGVGRPSRRRSMSTNDAEDMSSRHTPSRHQRGSTLPDIYTEVDHDDLLGKIERELNKAKAEPKKHYQIREHNTIYASSSTEKVSHMRGAGDIDAGRAWRMVRRPSDMNEYAREIREYRVQEKGKAYGKVFVKVLAIKNVHLPLPRERTAITCTLNNGIHFVTTPECQLGESAAIEQEFELIEHSKLEFTLTIKVRRDPHIAAQFQALVAPPPAAPVPKPVPPPVVQTQSKSGGMFSLFSSTPKKNKHRSLPPPVPEPAPSQSLAPHRLPENLARYLKPDGTMARAFVSFKDVVHRCDTRLFETSYPLIGQRAELGGKFSTQQVGEIVLQMFRLPALSGIPQDQLPQSLEECHRGLRHINWHKMTYFQGTLTQNGGDCSTWRRRHFRVMGGNLVAFNDVTKKAIATIDLKKAVGIEDDQDSSDHSRYETAMYGVERSFRLIFADEDITFFADTDEEKNKWLEVLRALVGHIPPHPLWAELLWQRQEELTKRAQAARQVVKPYEPSSDPSSSNAQQQPQR